MWRHFACLVSFCVLWLKLRLAIRFKISVRVRVRISIMICNVSIKCPHVADVVFYTPGSRASMHGHDLNTKLDPHLIQSEKNLLSTLLDWFCRLTKLASVKACHMLPDLIEKWASFWIPKLCVCVLGFIYNFVIGGLLHPGCLMGQVWVSWSQTGSIGYLVIPYPPILPVFIPIPALYQQPVEAALGLQIWWLMMYCLIKAVLLPLMSKTGSLTA